MNTHQRADSESCRPFGLLRWEKGHCMKKTIPKLLTLVCLLAALMGLSIVTAHAETVTGTISGGNEYRYHEDKTPVSQWGAFTSTKLKYFTRDDTGATVPAYCMEPAVRSPQGDAEYSSVSWSGLSWNQRYAVTLAMAYGYGGNYGFDMHPDCAQLATQAIIWEFVCGYRGTTYPYTLYDTTCKELFHYAGDDVAVAYDIIIDRIMQHGTIPSFAVRYRNQLSDANAIQLTWDGSRYTGTATDTNGVLSQYLFRANISGVTISQRRNVLTVTATKEAGAQLNGCVSSDYGYSLDVEGTESVLLEPSNGSNYQACAALTTLPDPVWAYVHFKVNIVEEKGSLTINKVDADTGAALSGVTYRLFDASGNKVADMTTGADGRAVFSDLPLGSYSYQEISAPESYVVDSTRYTVTISTSALHITEQRTNALAKGSIEILKVDAETRQPLAGVVYRLFDANGSKIADGTTDGNGKVTFSDLKPGKYAYQEISTVSGYLLDNTRYEFSLTSENLHVKVTRENMPTKGSLTIRKIDATGGPLAGAELLLEMSTDGQSWAEIDKSTTDSTGVAKWDNLKLGAKYRVTEVKAPAGYTLLPEPVSVDALTADAPDITVTLCNNADFVLPFTGGRGFAAPILFAALMLGMGVYFCKKSEFKKENN